MYLFKKNLNLAQCFPPNIVHIEDKKKSVEISYYLYCIGYDINR